MADIASEGVIRTDTLLPTAAEQQRLRTLLERTFGAPIYDMIEKVSERSVEVQRYLGTISASATVSTALYRVTKPCRFVRGDFSSISLNSAATLTADVLVYRTSGSYRSVYAAPVDIALGVVATATGVVSAEPSDASAFITNYDNTATQINLTVDDYIKVTWVAGSGGNPSGCEANLHFKLL